MPILRRDYDPARPTAAPAPRVPVPHREVSLPARARRLVSPSRKNRAWPAAFAVIALIVFAVVWAQTNLVLALVTALAALVAGAMLLTLMFGTAWIIQPRRPAPELPRYR
jgi:hypothetical protein